MTTAPTAASDFNVLAPVTIKGPKSEFDVVPIIIFTADSSKVNSDEISGKVIDDTGKFPIPLIWDSSHRKNTADEMRMKSDPNSRFFFMESLEYDFLPEPTAVFYQIGRKPTEDKAIMLTASQIYTAYGDLGAASARLPANDERKTAIDLKRTALSQGVASLFDKSDKDQDDSVSQAHADTFIEIRPYKPITVPGVDEQQVPMLVSAYNWDLYEETTKPDALQKKGIHIRDDQRPMPFFWDLLHMKPIDKLRPEPSREDFKNIFYLSVFDFGDENHTPRVAFLNLASSRHKDEIAIYTSAQLDQRVGDVLKTLKDPAVGDTYKKVLEPMMEEYQQAVIGLRLRSGVEPN